MSRSTARPASPSVAKRQPGLPRLAVGEHDFAPVAIGEKPAATRFGRPSRPKTGLPATARAGPDRAPGAKGCGCDARAGTRGPPRCRPREIPAAGQSKWAVSHWNDSPEHTQLCGTSKVSNPHKPSNWWRAWLKQAPRLSVCSASPENQRPVLRDQGVGHQRPDLLDHPLLEARKQIDGPESSAPRRGFWARAGRTRSARPAARKRSRRARGARHPRACRCRQSD